MMYLIIKAGNPVRYLSGSQLSGMLIQGWWVPSSTYHVNLCIVHSLQVSVLGIWTPTFSGRSKIMPVSSRAPSK